MVDFTILEERMDWLGAQKKGVAPLFAARAALRVVPLINVSSVANRKRMMRVFRAVAAAWAAAAYPGHRDALRGAARATLFGLGNMQLPTPVRSAVYAAATASASEADIPKHASTSVMYALNAAVRCGDEAFEKTLQALEIDADQFEQKFSPVILADSQLWPGRLPDWIRSKWDQLKIALLAANEDWEVWTDWYEARLKGGNAEQPIDIARVTISEDVWTQGPAVANRRIMALFSEHGFSRQLSAAERTRDQPTELSAAGSLSELEGRLAAMPPEHLRVVSARAALRAIPLLASSRRSPDAPEFASACLSAFSSAAKAWYELRHPARRDIGAAASAAFPDGNYEDDFGILIAGTIVSATHAGITSWTGAGCINRIQTIVERVDGAPGVMAFNIALSDDLRDLNIASALVIAGLPLWPGGSRPQWVTRRWEQLTRKLIKTGVGWEVWINWYEDRLLGNLRFDSHEAAYIEVPDQFLFDGPARVNTWILRQIEKSDQQRGQESGLVEDIAVSDASVPPSIPATQPAAIEPIWRNRRLTIPRAPTKTDLTGRKFAAALKSLRQEMRAFATDISAEANIDKRFAAYVSVLAEEIPVKLPRQDELFRLGHVESVFAGYSKTVNEEWPAILAARYHALSLSFDRTLRQSPLWREFKRNAAKSVLTSDQIRSAGTLANDVAVMLRGEEAKELIDPGIPQTLIEVAESLPTAAAANVNTELPKDGVDRSLDLLAYDLIESVNNILKSIFQAAIWARIAATTKEAGYTYSEAALKSIITEAKRLGKNTGPVLSKWIRRLILGGAGAAAYHIAGKPLIVWLIANYPEAFRWLESAAHFLSSQ